jgi:hypothetical protein
MAWLLLWLTVVRPYHAETVASLGASRYTHVEVISTVTYVNRHEADGDIHFRLSDDLVRFIVCEIVPTLRALPPLQTPVVAQRIRVRGIRRYDTAHGWAEIHPVEFWEAWP